MALSDTAESIVAQIVDDLSGRSGLGNEWDQIDEQTKKEIIEHWEYIVLRMIS